MDKKAEKSWNDYYRATLSQKPSKILAKFFELGLDNNIKDKKAIDLGCGAGNDTIYLLKKGYSVIAVDKEKDVENIIVNRITEAESTKLHFIISKFGGVKLPKASLVIANFSVSFCLPKYFKKFCNEFTNCIIPGGYFVGNFLGKEDDWKNKKTMTFVDEKEIKAIFKNFEMVYFNEQKHNKLKKATGKIKHWHVYQVIAKKICIKIDNCTAFMLQ